MKKQVSGRLLGDLEPAKKREFPHKLLGSILGSAAILVLLAHLVGNPAFAYIGPVPNPISGVRTVVTMNQERSAFEDRARTSRANAIELGNSLITFQNSGEYPGIAETTLFTYLFEEYGEPHMYIEELTALIGSVAIANDITGVFSAKEIVYNKATQTIELRRITLRKQEEQYLESLTEEELAGRLVEVLEASRFFSVAETKTYAEEEREDSPFLLDITLTIE